jgi:asparagine synthase (glutamine-hydrolysing)
VRAATDALAAHGRDGGGLWDGRDIALGWRQTTLHREDAADIQPRIGGAGRYRLVFDGRIDNRADLAAALALPPESARDWPDSAYVLAAWERWGEACVARLLGDFAFAVWDAEQRALFLARDPFGRRPLFYHRARDFFVFATMPSALFTHHQIPRAIDTDSLLRDLCLRRIEAPASFYRDIARVPVAHLLRVDALGLRTQEYWRLEDVAPLRLGSDGAYVEALREVFDQAVACRLRTNQPVATHLSGGWDSSSVTAVTARQLAERGERLTAFTHVPPAGWRPGYEPPGQNSDEGPLAAMVAAKLGNVDHIRVPGSGRWDFDGLDAYADGCERPRWDVNNGGWADDLHQRARAMGVRVMLTGGEGNLTISQLGTDLLAKLLRGGRWAQLAREWHGLYAGGESYRRLAALTAGPIVPASLWPVMQRALGRNTAEPASEFLTPAGLARYRRAVDDTPGRINLPPTDRRARMRDRSRFDHGVALGGSLAAWDLVFVDPTGDRRMIEFCYAVPDDQFLRDGATKWLLRRAMTGILPDTLLTETCRGRQGADWRDTASAAFGLLSAEIDRLAAEPKVREFLDIAHIARTLEEWRAAGPATATSWQHEFLLRTIAIGRFVRRFAQGHSPPDCGEGAPLSRRWC